jgi:hypothetical protein
MGDFVEIGITLMSLMGTVASETLKWHPIVTNSIPNQASIREYNRSVSITPERNKYQKYFADLSRVCEVEEAVEEWFDI